MARTADAKKFVDILTLDSELNRIKDVDILLERILAEARRVVGADAGTIYIKHGGNLKAEFAQNDTKQKDLPSGQKLIYQVFEFPINKTTVSGYVAVTGELLNIKDAYNLPDNVPYSYNTKYDQIAKYKCASLLTIPLLTNNGDLLGVMQFINKLSEKGNIIRFTREDEVLVTHFANNVTIALQRAQMTRALILRMISMAELRDPAETGQHVNRVAGYSVEVYERWAQKHGVAEHEIMNNVDNLRMAAMLHDVGKVAISDLILKKPARFTDEEYQIMKTHTVLGAQLFNNKQSDLDEMALEIVLTHHERWDGKGYPGNVDFRSPHVAREMKKARGLKHEEIPIWGRIVAIADVYDALSSKRVYKDAWKEEDVLEEISNSSGSHFDPDVVEAFFDVLPNIQAIESKYREHSL